MIDVIEQTDKLINEFNDSDFVKNMRILKKKIKEDNLINDVDIRSLYQNDTIHEYVENQNILDMHIYYLNKEINKLIDDKICRSNNESN